MVYSVFGFMGAIFGCGLTRCRFLEFCGILRCCGDLLVAWVVLLHVWFCGHCGGLLVVLPLVFGLDVWCGFWVGFVGLVVGGVG